MSCVDDDRLDPLDGVVGVCDVGSGVAAGVGAGVPTGGGAGLAGALWEGGGSCGAAQADPAPPATRATMSAGVRTRGTQRIRRKTIVMRGQIVRGTANDRLSNLIVRIVSVPTRGAPGARV